MITYEFLIKKEVDSVHELIMSVFEKHVAPGYSTSGIKKFKSLVSPSSILERSNQTDSFVITAKKKEKILGMLKLKNGNHVSLIFVDSDYQGEGIGRNLIEKAIEISLERDSDISAISVCASPNSVNFYKSLGFNETDDELDADGMRYTPMQKQLNKETRTRQVRGISTRSAPRNLSL